MRNADVLAWLRLSRLFSLGFSPSAPPHPQLLELWSFPNPGSTKPIWPGDETILGNPRSHPETGLA
jgi:hypothetical protein